MIKISSCFILLLLFVLHPGHYVSADQTLSLVSQNMNRFFDAKDDGLKEKIVSQKTYQKRIIKLTERILTNFARPDVVALQEIENLDILNDVVDRLKKMGLDYQAVLIEGNDISGIDVGFLVKKRYRIIEQKQLFKHMHFANTESLLFSRPPLLIEVCMAECITMVNVHLRSMRDLRDKKEGTRVAKKRKQQAETIARWVNQFQISNPKRRLILIGDFNALPQSDNYVDVIGTIRGKPDKVHPKFKSNDLVKRDLIDLTRSIPVKYRYSFNYKKHKQQLDYLLISDSKNLKLKKLKFDPVDYKFSDHAALIGEIELSM